MKKRLMALLAVGMMGVTVLAGCGGDSKTSSTSSKSASETSEKKDDGKLTKVRVAFMPNYASTWDAVAAKEKGYFEEEGLDVEFTQFQDGPTEIAAMEGGSIDVAYIGPGAHTLAIKGNVQVFCFDHLGDADSVIGLKSHGVNSLKDLKGKKVAYASGTSSEMILNRALKSVGLTMNDIQPYDMKVNNMVSAMVSGSIDAAAIWSPNTQAVQEQVGDDVEVFCTNMSFTDEAADCASWIATPKYVKANRDTLVKFTRALYKGMDYGVKKENQDEVAGWVATLCGVDKANVVTQVNDGAWLTKDELLKQAGDGTIEKYYQVQQDGFLANGKITDAEKTDVKNYVLFDIMTEAGK